MQPPGERQHPRGADVRGEGHYRHSASFPRGAKGGRSRRGIGDDGGGADGAGDLRGGGADGIGGGCLQMAMLGIDDAAIDGVFFCYLGDAAHHADRSQRIAPRGAFRRQHDRVRAVINGVGDIGHLGPCRHGGGDHALQHLRRDDDGLARLARAGDDMLLDGRDFLHRHLDAKIAARHHDGVGEVDDLVNIANGGGLFDLRHDSGAPGDKLLDFGDILGPLHEGQRDPVDPEFEREIQIAAVLVGQRAHADDGIGYAHPLAIGNFAADLHLAVDEVLARPCDDEAQLAIVEQQEAAVFQTFENCRMGQGNPCRIARRFIEIKPEGRAIFQHNRTFGKAADPDLRPLQVGENGDGPAAFLLQLADDLIARRMVRMVAVAEIEAEYIRPRKMHGLDRFRIGAGRAEGGYNLGLTLSSHSVSPE